MESEVSSCVPLGLPLVEKSIHENRIGRAFDLLIFFLLLSLLAHRLVSLKEQQWLPAFLCESYFSFNWLLILSLKWNQCSFTTYPQRMRSEMELPKVDILVTTADSILEPPIITVNTVLSLLALQYPTNKLALYVSDDGCSQLIYYSLVEAIKFAKLWVPFCKKYDIQVRAPFRYFTHKPQNELSDFQREWNNVKNEYARLCKKIESADERTFQCDNTLDYAVFSNVHQSDHPTIIKVIWENKEGMPSDLPHLIYISREKRPNHPHHYKAGAMNVLARVSGIMTNAPIMLNVDCDMHANNPQVVHHAMCMLYGFKDEQDCGFAQFPQIFYDGLKDDPFGNQLISLRYISDGIAALQGTFYAGSNCFHRRKAIYGLSPNERIKAGNEDLERIFGKSDELKESAARILSGSHAKEENRRNPSCFIEAANEVASCGYEYGTSWGKKVGWMYGSATEDVLTGLTIHARGWRSIVSSPDPPAFLGCAALTWPSALTQQKRWVAGLLEILFSHNNPLLLTLKGKLWFRQSLAYLWLCLWAVRSVPELCYALLPAYSILTNSHLLPKVNEPAFILPVAIFVTYNLYVLWELLRLGQSIRMWWNVQRMGRVNCMTAGFFGYMSVMMKLMGLSESVFEITQKLQSGDDAKSGRFTFDKSPMIVPGLTILLVNLFALVYGASRLQHGRGVGEMFCSVCVCLCFWDFLKGLFGTGKYGIPYSTICKSGALAFLFVHLCTRV